MTTRHYEQRAEQSAARIHGAGDIFLVHWTDKLDARRHLSLGFSKESIALRYARALIKTDHRNVRVFKGASEIAADK